MLNAPSVQDFRTCHKHIQRIAQIAKTMATEPKTTQRDLLMAQNVQTAMATKVQELSSTFRKKQSVYLQRAYFAELFPVPGGIQSAQSSRVTKSVIRISSPLPAPERGRTHSPLSTMTSSWCAIAI
jgi:hypothetical protein